MSAPELKPCPFCMSKARLALGEHTFDGAEVMCTECGCQGGHHDDDPMGEEAIAAWNRRTDAIQSAEYVAGLDAALHEIVSSRARIDISAETFLREFIRPIARAALAAKPQAAPVVRVVTVETLERWAYALQYSDAAVYREIRAIIATAP